MLVVALDGACGPAVVAYAAVLVDDAEVHSMVQVEDPDSVAEEWPGRFFGLHLLQQNRPSSSVRVLALANNTPPPKLRTTCLLASRC